MGLGSSPWEESGRKDTMDQKRRTQRRVRWSALFLFGARGATGSNRKGLDLDPVQLHFAQAVFGSLANHQNLLGLKTQELAAEGI